MRNNLRFSWLISLLLAVAVPIAANALVVSEDGLSLDSPSTCPSSGCAAGQRLNFTVDFSVDPQYTSGSNTQICVYAPEDGVSGPGVTAWADFSQWLISDDSPYTFGQVNSVCTNAEPAGDEYLAGAYATHPNPIQDEIQFALNIHRSTDLNGHVRVKVLQAVSAGTNWVETSGPGSAFTENISVAALGQTVYTAELPWACGSLKPCFVHSGDDEDGGGQGTGLYDAIQALDPGGEIIILKDYRIRTNPVRVDKALTIRGHNEESMLTSINSEQACSNSLLLYKSGGVLQDLQINDGNCPANNSRTLVEINSPDLVTIQSSTLTSGDIAIRVRDNTGKVDIKFNEITNNQQSAVLIDPDPDTTDPDYIERVNMYANNILKNGSTEQVSCNDGGYADHNFWGEGELASENTSNCTLSPGKELGAPILTAPNGHGVQAILAAVKGKFTYFDYFNEKIGAGHSEGDDYNLVIVNHGQGTIENIPFYESGSGEITPCGNFYDIFLAPDASPKHLELTLKYDLNAQCINIIESEYYCGNTNQSHYPLWWYDPVMNITAGWDRTGQDPQGTGGVGYDGQITTCDMGKHEITVEIDFTGRPGLLSDLNFTPFTTGYIDGATLTDFSAAFTNFYSQVTWTTSREKNVKRYELLRSQNQTSGYEVINTVNVTSDSATTNTYQFFDYDVDLSTTYYYQLRVIHNSESDEIIGSHGPITLNVPAPTVTTTPTVTLTPKPTSTPAYKTPTRPIYRSPTPAGTPTQVRTYGPTPTGGAKPTFEPSLTGTITLDADAGYPAGEQGTPTQTKIPGSGDQTTSPTQTAEGSQASPSPQGTDPAIDGSNGGQGNGSDTQPAPRAVHLFIGAAGGLILLLGASIITAKLLFQ
jgi:hypothetical protein